jgi:hypothetical protein
VIESTQGSLVIVGANTEAPQVFWNGANVLGVTGVIVENDLIHKRVVLKVREDPILAEMQAAGIIIRRG